MSDIDVTNIKGEIRKLVSEAKASVGKITKESVPNCDAFQLSYLMGDADEARGTASTLIKLFPEDNEIRQMWKDAVNIHVLAYKGRDRFIAECECKKRRA